ncbi:MAG: hypothetical protein NT154_15600, partial [Verrucomicrobia bacterium]|nr:hypothetical protein [Verrucomicrobiota bacterium]
NPQVKQEPREAHCQNQEPPDDADSKTLPRSRVDERIRSKMRQRKMEAEILEQNARRGMPLAELQHELDQLAAICESLEKTRHLMQLSRWPRVRILAEEVQDILNSSVFWS